MKTENIVHHGINIGLHICILFTFLTILFFALISKTETKATTDMLNKAISKYTPQTLHMINKYSKKVNEPDGIVKWNVIDNLATKLNKKYDGPDPAVKQHNNNLQIKTIVITVVLWLVLISAIVYFVHFKQMDIQLGSIIRDNALIFGFVGIIEVVFFMTVVLKYVPITSTDMTNDVVDRVEYHVKRQLK